MSVSRLVFLFATIVAGCGNNGGNNDMAMSLDMAVSLDMGAAGGPQACTVALPADTHCDATGDMSARSQSTSQASCHPDTDAAAPMADFGDTMCGTSGKDDDCKYQVNWTSTPIYRNFDVAFTVTLAANEAGNQVTGAGPRVEAYLTDTHPAPASGTATEMGGGVYKISGVRFDAAGQWTVRFHFFETCSDLFDDSPHGHSAFFVNVP